VRTCKVNLYGLADAEDLVVAVVESVGKSAVDGLVSSRLLT
jgi:hypothetical protein